jgi:hypothetical protein
MRGLLRKKWKTKFRAKNSRPCKSSFHSNSFKTLATRQSEVPILFLAAPSLPVSRTYDKLSGPVCAGMKKTRKKTTKTQNPEKSVRHRAPQK